MFKRTSSVGCRNPPDQSFWTYFKNDWLGVITVKKYAPRKVFILENGEYVELTYEKFESRKANDPTYEDRHFIPVQGFLLEVSQECYEDFYRAKEREKYLRKLNAKYGLLSIDAFDNEDDNGTDYIQAETEDVAEAVTHLLMLDKLRSVIPMLSENEQELISDTATGLWSDLKQIEYL